MNKSIHSSLAAIRRLSFVLGGALLSLNSHAAITDIANAPLVAVTTNVVKPNLLFILDDSGSMAFDYMPDHSRTALCRQTGAGIDAATYSGTFSRLCCESGNSSSTCLSGTPPFARRQHPPLLAAEFNGMAYNPATRYRPPVNADGTSWSSMTSANTSAWTSVKVDAYEVQSTSSINLVTGFPDILWCPAAESADSECLRNGNYVLPGRVGAVDYTVYRVATSSGTEQKVAVGAPDAATVEARDVGPHYYRIIASEFCTSEDLRVCVSQASATATHSFPAPLRWCNSDANARASVPGAGSCQAVRTDAVYSHARYPTKYATAGVPAIPPTTAVAAQTPAFSLDLSGCNNSRQISIGPMKVGTTDLLGGSTTALTRNQDTLATRLRDLVNANTLSHGYSATVTSGNRLRLIAPVAAGNLTATATLTRAAGSHNSCVLSLGSTPTFAGYAAATPGTPGTPGGFPGGFERVDIVPSRTAYPGGGDRSDCANPAACTYAEEMTNFANWWAYYRTRMQAMKSSTSQSFAAVGSNRRLGYLSINNATGSDFLNVNVFQTTHKTNWFNKLFDAKPSGSTPLRTALTRAGRLFGGRLNGSSVNGSTVVDPMEYSCQKNFTILSTDGYWNETDLPKKLDGSTDIGEQDASLDSPMKDRNNTANTLADTSSYYFRTDLRHNDGSNPAFCTKLPSGQDLCGNSADLARAPHEVQNMRTFTLGLGASGNMLFRKDYLAATTGDYFAVKEGSAANPAGGICSWQASGACTWPTPESNKLTTIDDLWHTAVNGDGTYFSARDTQTLFEGLYSVLTAIDRQIGAAAAATTSNPNVSAGDNQIFVSTYTTGAWTGDLNSRRIDISTGAVDNESNDWSARDLLNANASRNIFMFDATQANKLKAFAWGQLNATEQGYFAQTYIGTGANALSQFCGFGPFCLSAATQTAAAGEPLVRFIAGERSNEGGLSQTAKYFREREHLLGDIVNSEATYVRRSRRTYNDAAFKTHRLAISSRSPTVYVGANDGMLHAINAETGQERWAYIPTAVLPKLYRLADKEYASKHEYYVNSSPVAAEVKIGTSWRTVLIGGLGAGGRAYYALDVTDPSAPRGLWEFKHDNLGFTMGRPEIGTLADGTWVAFLPSGYNNVSPGDGKGHLFVVKLSDGTLVRTISTGQGDTGTPSNLGHIRAWLDDGMADPKVMRVYGGDNMGNVWRFDVNDNVGAAGYDAQRLATLKSVAGAAQPISSRPEVGLVTTDVASYAMVYVGTGRYLGVSDLSDTSTGTIYGIKDRLSAQDWGDPRTAVNGFVKQTLSTTSTCPPNTEELCEAGDTMRTTATPLPVNLETAGGWYVDLLVSSERVNTDPQLVLGILAVNSNIVDTGNVCRAGGTSWINYIDYATGGTVSAFLGNALATSPTAAMVGSQLIDYTVLGDDSGATKTKFRKRDDVNATRRVSWRDLVHE